MLENESLGDAMARLADVLDRWMRCPHIADVLHLDRGMPIYWLERMARRMNMAVLDDEPTRLQYYAINLRGPVYGWASSLLRGNAFTPAVTMCAEFERKFLDFFRPIYCHRRGRVDLYQLQQRGSVAEYAREHQSIVSSIEDLTPDECLATFTSGLKPELQRESSVHFASSYEEALVKAQWQEQNTRRRRQRNHTLPAQKGQR